MKSLIDLKNIHWRRQWERGKAGNPPEPTPL